MKQQADSEIQTSEQPAGRPRVNPRVARDRVISANNEPWAVVPPKKAASKKRKALRIALIVAAVGAAAAGAAVVFGWKIKEYLPSRTSGVIGRPIDPEQDDPQRGEHYKSEREVGDLIAVPLSDNHGGEL